MASSKELARTGQFLPLKMAPNEITELLEAALGDEALSPSDLQRIPMPGSGALVWTLRTAGGEEVVKEFQAIIVAQQQVRARWDSEYTGQRVPPVCVSPDGIRGIGDPGIECAVCPHAQFGSGRGKAQACALRRLVFFLREGNVLPSYISLPPTSQSVAKNYALRLMSEGYRPYDVVTTFALERASSNGQTFSRVVLSLHRVLDESERRAMEEYTKMMRGLLARRRLAPADVGEFVEPV